MDFSILKRMKAFLFLVVLFPYPIPAQKMAPFSLGERLEYGAKFGLLNLGSMTLEIRDTVMVGDKIFYTITSYLSSNSDLNFIFSIYDTINTITSMDELLPYILEKRLHEGRYKNYQRLEFNQDSLSVLINDSIKVKTSAPVRDILSLWYYLRKVPLIEDDTIRLLIFETKGEHKIDCIIGKKESVKTPLGKFSAIRVMPQTKGKGVFGAGGSMDIWYSDDANRLPVQIKTKLKFGTVVFKLKGVQY